MIDARKLLLLVAARALIGDATPVDVPKETAIRGTVGADALRARIVQQRRQLLAPPPKLTVSEWADRYRVVPSYSADAGPWITDRTPHLREIMDCFSDPSVNRVVFKKCARIGATEAGLNIIGYFIHQDPSRIMVVQPTVDDAKEFSKEQLGATISDTPVLAERVASGIKESSNTILLKSFPGGSIVMGGANSPRFFRRRTVRVIVLEEVNGYSSDIKAKGEGDQLKLAETRSATMTYRRKTYINSTPTTKGNCRITKEFESGDQRHRFVPCPSCNHFQTLVWEQLKYKDLPEPAYECIACKYHITASEKDAMLAKGEWRATRNTASTDTRSYTINALYSTFVPWTTLVREWIEAQDDKEALQTFTNLSLGEAWEDRELQDVQEALKARAKQYEPDGAAWRVPRAASALFCGVDKQHMELHAVVRAYGPGEQSWLIDRVVFRGDTTQPAVWAELDVWHREKRWRHEGGALLGIQGMCVDSSDDPNPVYEWTRPRLSSHVYAIKGGADPNASILPKKYTKTHLKSRLYSIGTQVVKKRLLARARMIAPIPYTLDAPGRGFMHFNERANEQYFAEFFSNVFERRAYRDKQVTMYVLPPGRKDESLDCEVYAYVALQLVAFNSTFNLEEEWVRVIEEGEKMQHPQPESEPPKPEPTNTGGWMSSVRRSGKWMP